jgi:hypothetical protein
MHFRHDLNAPTPRTARGMGAFLPRSRIFGGRQMVGNFRAGRADSGWGILRGLFDGGLNMTGQINFDSAAHLSNIQARRPCRGKS